MPAPRLLLSALLGALAPPAAAFHSRRQPPQGDPEKLDDDWREANEDDEFPGMDVAALVKGNKRRPKKPDMRYRNWPWPAWVDTPFVDEISGKVDIDLVKERLAGRSLLLFGSSLDRNAVQWGCMAMGAWAAFDTKFYKAYSCEVGQFTLAMIINYGTGEPSYWKMAYELENNTKMRPGTHERTEDHIKYDATDFAQRVLRAAPTAVVVDSSLWDLAKWWQQAGMPETSDVAPEKLQGWCDDGLPELLRWVSSSFPKSKVAIRTPPRLKVAQYGRSPQAMATMADCIRTNISSDYDVMDYNAIVEQMLTTQPPWAVFADKTHPNKRATMKYLDMLLNYVQKQPIRPR